MSAQIKSFLLQSPPGQFNDVLTSIKALLKNNAEFESEFVKVAQEYYEDNFAFIDSQLVSKHNKTKDGYAFKGTNFSVDFISLVTVLFNLEQSELNAYVTSHYENGNAAIIAKANEIVIVICSDKYNPDNFWSGHWQSQWTIKENAEITGTIQCHVHYYEDGNVQLNTTKTIIGNASDPIAFIKKSEAALQESFNESLTNLNESLIKQLRRQLPITRSKVEWEKLSTYRISHDMNQV